MTTDNKAEANMAEARWIFEAAERGDVYAIADLLRILGPHRVVRDLAARLPEARAREERAARFRESMEADLRAEAAADRADAALEAGDRTFARIALGEARAALSRARKR